MAKSPRQSVCAVIAFGLAFITVLFWLYDMFSPHPHLRFFRESRTREVNGG